MKSIDQVGITFANVVVGRGVFNSVVNISLAALQFSPTEDGKVDSDPAITCRLRMDLPCARQLRDTLDDLLTRIEKTEHTAANAAAPNGDAAHLPDETLN